MVKFIEVVSNWKGTSSLRKSDVASYSLSEVWINENYVVSLKEASRYRALLQDGKLPGDLDPDHDFTTITTNHTGVAETRVVVGGMSAVAAELNGTPAKLLKG
jgi:hypothetical protein